MDLEISQDKLDHRRYNFFYHQATNCPYNNSFIDDFDVYLRLFYISLFTAYKNNLKLCRCYLSDVTISYFERTTLSKINHLAYRSIYFLPK